MRARSRTRRCPGRGREHLRDEAGRVRFHYVIIDLLAEYVGGELAPASDIGDARWVREEELAELDVTKKARELVREVLSQRSLGDKVTLLQSDARNYSTYARSGP